MVEQVRPVGAVLSNLAEQVIWIEERGANGLKSMCEYDGCRTIAPLLEGHPVVLNRPQDAIREPDPPLQNRPSAS